MDAKTAASVGKLTEEIHENVDEIYEAIVDEDSTAPSLIDSAVQKLKSLKSNLSNTNEV